MLPSMRYETRKLAELYHKKKSYQDHRNSINKIMSKSPKQPIDRTRDINYQRNKMHSAFNHTQNVRARDIHKDNLKLYKKCYDTHHRIPERHLAPNSSACIDEPQSGLYENEETKEINSSRGELLLKNHRNESITKLTGYERSRQNLRLAIKIAKPSPTINTRKLEKIHQEASKRKERIMHYQSSNLKSQKYLQKRFSSASLSSQRSSFSPSGQSSPKPISFRNTYGGIANYLNTKSPGGLQQKRKPVFRGNFNESFNFQRQQRI